MLIDQEEFVTILSSFDLKHSRMSKLDFAATPQICIPFYINPLEYLCVLPLCSRVTIFRLCQSGTYDRRDLLVII